MAAYDIAFKESCFLLLFSYAVLLSLLLYGRGDILFVSAMYIGFHRMP